MRKKTGTERMKIAKYRNFMKNLYILSPEIKWKSFKKLWDISNKNETGPIGGEMLKGKIIWEMLRDGKITLSIEDDDIYFITKPLKASKNTKLFVIK